MTAKQRMRRKKIVATILPKLKKLFPRSEIALHYKTPWQLLVAVILSAQCTDKKVNEVTSRLFQKYKTPDDYIRVTQNVLEHEIYSTGFYRAKALHIKQAARMVKKRFGGSVPRTMSDMCLLPGVARKTANIVLGTGYDIVVGIAVDTHVKRLARLLGLTDHSDPNKIELDLMEVVPRREWVRFPLWLIAYGRAYCPARNHNHKECPLSNH